MESAHTAGEAGLPEWVAEQQRELLRVTAKLEGPLERTAAFCIILGNSKKLYEKQSRYPNVEVDLVFRKDRVFDVTHDVDTSFNLSLGSYFSYMKDHEGKMWLDIKNLTAGNKHVALEKMNEMTEYFQIAKDRLDYRKLAKAFQSLPSIIKRSFAIWKYSVISFIFSSATCLFPAVRFFISSHIFPS